MITDIANMAEVFLGIGEPYPKADIVNFISGNTGKSKTYWNNKSDAIFYSYHRAVKEKNYPAWTSSSTTGNKQIVDFVTGETGLDRQDVNTYLLSLFTMANMGKIKTEFWNPAGLFSQYGTKQITEGLKQFISPVTETAGAPLKNLYTGLLIAGGLTAIGIFASKQFIKTKALSRGKK